MKTRKNGIRANSPAHSNLCSRQKKRRKIRSSQKFRIRLVCLCVFFLFAACTGIYVLFQNYPVLESRLLPADYDTSGNLPVLSSQTAVLMEEESGTILGTKNPDLKTYPASLTKIMTAVVFLERLSSLQETVTFQPDMFPELTAQNASVAGFAASETVPAKDVLYGMLLPSGADCCIAAADYISGSETAFVRLMNEKAADLGMKNTHFQNSTGLHDAKHYSTARDLAVLLKYALQNEDFRAAFTSDVWRTSKDTFHPDGLLLYSTMFQKLPETSFAGGKILGGKTGYTEEAGLCLASLAQIHDKNYLLVTTGASGSHETEPFHILDAVSVYGQLPECYLNIIT